MTHRGVAPLDPDTKVGRLRALLRDTEYAPLEPAEDGFGDYKMFSDVDLEAYLIEGGDNVLRAAGRATTGLALMYSAKGKSIKTDDLAVDLRGRGADLLKVARSFMDDADAEDAAEASDYFNIVPTGRRDRRCHAEGDSWSFIDA
jgi:hypothetical protein